MSKAQTRTYKTLNGATSAAVPGTQPLLLESAEQATELGYDIKHVGKYVLVSITPLDEANEGDVVQMAGGGLEQLTENGTSITITEPTTEGDEPEQVIEVPNMVKGGRLEQSTVKKPVQVVHDHVKARLEQEPNVRRKDLMKELIDMGVAFYTARTQVQIALKKYRGQQGVGAAVAAPPEPVQVEADGTVVIDGSPMIQDAPPADAEPTEG